MARDDEAPEPPDPGGAAAVMKEQLEVSREILAELVAIRQLLETQDTTPRAG